MIKRKLKILAFAGSLRKKSYNRSLVRAAKKLAPEEVEIEIFDLEGIPFMNEDVEAVGLPKKVLEFRNKIEKADALLIATPEYNRMIPGVLKNALEWASRKVDEKQPLVEKPLAVMGASPGGFGTARAQQHMKTLAAILHMYLYDGVTELLVSKAHEKFNEEGELTDDKTKESLVELVKELRDWTLKLGGVEK